MEEYGILDKPVVIKRKDVAGPVGIPAAVASYCPL